MKTGRTMLMAILLALSSGIAWAGCPSTDDVGYAKGRMYEHTECGGWWAGLNASTYAKDFRSWGGNINDMISSIVLGDGVKCTFYQHINFGGSSFSMTKGTQANLVKIGWNDKISSAKCVPWNQ